MPKDLLEVVYMCIIFFYSLSQAPVLSEIVGIGIYNKLYSCYVNSAKYKTNSFSLNKHQIHSVRLLIANKSSLIFPLQLYQLF